jgi:hypothetical protein
VILRDVPTRSGTLWPFWKLMRGLVQAGRAPRIIVLENVYGALTSHGGKDFAAICSALSGSDYRFGAASGPVRLAQQAIRSVGRPHQKLFLGLDDGALSGESSADGGKHLADSDRRNFIGVAAGKQLSDEIASCVAVISKAYRQSIRKIAN